MRAEGDLELVAQQQVPDHKVGRNCGKALPEVAEEKAEWLEHRERVADLAGRSFALLQPSSRPTAP